MPTLLVKNTDVLVSLDSQRRELKGAGLYAENGFIKQIGATGEQPATVLDLSGQIVPPYFVSLHYPINQMLIRSLPAAQNNHLFPWLQGQYRK